MLADAQTFLAPPGQPPVVPAGLDLDLAIMTPCPPFVTGGEKMVEETREFRRQLEAQGIRIVRTRDDLEKQGGLRVVLSLQHPPTNTDWTQWLIALWEEGVRITTLAYRDTNPYGAGFSHPDFGLTPKGEELVNVLIKTGYVIDLAHASQQTARGTVDILLGTTETAMISHTGILEVYDHPRNANVDLIKDVISVLNGFVGLYTMTFGLDGVRNSLEPIEEHLKALMTINPTIRNIGFGTDGTYTSMTNDEISTQFEFMKRVVDQDGSFRSRCPMEAWQLTGPKKMGVLDEMVTEMLADSANASARSRIMGGNLHDFLSRALPVQ